MHISPALEEYVGTRYAPPPHWRPSLDFSGCDLEEE